tara:strand:- start:1734 stop:2072 length:339 start_codon:yes stop_codon:yes gene_type:complete
LNSKTLYIIIGVLILIIVGVSLGWYFTATLAGGGIVSTLFSRFKKEKGFREEQRKIENDTFKKEKKVEKDAKEALSKSREQEIKENALVQKKPDSVRNDHLDQLASDFERTS